MSQEYTFQDILFFALYASTATVALVASLYLLLRRSNAFAPDVTPPLRLRRWTAASFAVVGLSHLWWLFIRYAPLGAPLHDRILLCSTLDTLTAFPVILCTMLVMLQDRRRSLWPVAAFEVFALTELLFAYLLGDRTSQIVILLFFVVLLCVSAFMVVTLRQYDRWLLENYADLEHKEVRLAFLVMIVFLLVYVSYGLADEYFFFEVFIEVVDIILIILLLWRVETLQTLGEPDENGTRGALPESDPIFEKLSLLLQKHCIDTQYYLHQDASLTNLARLIGTNTTYLSQHFSQQGLTYNTYINGQRIQHFERLYLEALSNHQSVTATELSSQCGFRSYKTFSAAFKQIKRQTVADWMRNNS